MTNPDRLISTSFGRLWAPAIAVALATPTWGQSVTEVSRVSLTVQDGQTTRPTAGLLYRALPDRREYIADVSETGKTDRPVKCGPSDKFEAQAESKLDRPVAPVRLSCAQTLAFSFARIFVTAFPRDLANVLANTGAAPKVFSNYADVFAKNGKYAAAKTWTDAAKMSTAEYLGDTKFDKFLYRNPDKGYELAFTPSGIVALKAKQSELGIKTSGVIDLDTQNALAKHRAWSNTVDALKCKQQDGQFLCEPVTAGDKPTSNVVILPEVRF